MPKQLEIRQFEIREANWDLDGPVLSDIRRLVFIVEQSVPQEEEWDGRDEASWHWVATDSGDEPIGTARLLPEGQIGRMAVLQDHRRHGIGAALLEGAVDKARRLGFANVFLNAQTHALTFYEKCGFSREGNEFLEAGIPHYRMVRTLDPPSNETDDPQQHAAPAGKTDSDSSPVSQTASYRLGQDDNLILLRKEEEFRNVILAMCKQATRSIRIFSPVLEHKLFDNTGLNEICSALARRNKYTRVDILIYDSHRIIKNGHALLELSRKLSSSMAIRIVDPELRHLDHEFVLVDDYGVIYRREYEVFDGYANFSDLTECNRYGRDFKTAWERGLLDANLRQLYL